MGDKHMVYFLLSCLHPSPHPSSPVDKTLEATFIHLSLFYIEQKKAKLQKSKSFENNENGNKDDKEEKAGQDSEGLSDGNKTGNEKEASTLESPSSSQFPGAGRPIRSMLTPHSSNTSVESGADSQQDRGKPGTKAADHEETDDPSGEIYPN